MSSAIIITPDIESTWPLAADYAHRRWREESAEGEVVFVRLEPGDKRPVGEILSENSESSPQAITRLISFGPALTEECLAMLPNLQEVAVTGHYGSALTDAVRNVLEARGIRWYKHNSEGYWGQSVSEFGLALTLCGLRRIPQTHHQIITDLTPWDYNPPDNIGRPGQRGHQFGDDANFTNGTVAGKRVRIVGAGNIASRYASFVNMLGADVAAWDPYATEPNFHRAGSRREYHLDRLVQDAEIFVPMVPLTETTKGIVTSQHIEALPKGCLVVLVTRAGICDVPALRRRVLNDELALAADVFDIEPLPLNDPLLGRHNVVHTPHNAGRTQHANEQWAEALLTQFTPR
jgi:phosphoglycerate dehydrogenase-like enzyme